MKIYLNRQSLIDYLLVFLFYCVSGNPAFVGNPIFGKLMYFAMLVVLLVFSKGKFAKAAVREIIFWTALLAVIFTVQFFSLGSVSVLASLNFIIRIVCAILLAYYMNDRLPLAALKVMSAVCAVSLVFYVMNLLGVRFLELVPISTQGESIVIYTQMLDLPGDSFLRNCGMFWEPGAFAGYIIATILLSVNNLKYIWDKYRMNCIVMVLALLSTTSTTGYIALAILVIYAVFSFSKSRKKAFFLIAPFVAIILAAFLNLDFLGEKVRNELIKSVEVNGLQEDVSRTGSLLVDAQYIAEKPLFGNGLAMNTRFRFHSYFSEQSLASFSNGFSGILASMGCIFFLLYILAIVSNETLEKKVFLILMIVLLLQGEYFMNYPFFMIFPFADYGGESKRRGFLKNVRFLIHE